MGTGQPDPHEYRVLSSEPVYEGRVISLVKDTVAMPGGGDSVREVVHHPGAVAVVALTDADEVVLLRQYRHPVGGYLWELPAGLRDADGEPPLETAQRELAEEVRLSAARWSLLTTHYSSPGFCDEQVLVYLAEGLTDVDRPEGFTVEHEELDMTVERVPLADAVQRVFDGGIRNVAAVVGLLAAAQVRAAGPELRPVDAG
ncbi:NUDIX hydrolase [Blastococcus sp. MG754426]|uniref:NUDIX domain-containing protein n=1 Tax=unclassified Blastococcus TaxID=2619396 RepID=UPI001EEF8E78|nr:MULTISPECIES: NUDIX hydrolase [unclassified Blastococcus]MCF6508582.1 NUDIX hydrolase [Blastococcus sp. MG754426]MCF6513160.1 NUDIX hydrolase [Blastococcus sp. MG754427]MCF6736010.1 NUDIX hydrolase [Blastococcus sp. KM273129]